MRKKVVYRQLFIKFEWKNERSFWKMLRKESILSIILNIGSLFKSFETNPRNGSPFCKDTVWLQD